MSESNPFLTTLLNLNFREVPLAERRKIGHASSSQKADSRPLWNPRLIVDGQMMTNPSFFAYKARWPSDGSELSRKIVEIYLPAEDGDHTWYPAYFPYWLEVDGKIGSAKARVIDSGLQAQSPKSGFPKRAPQLLGEAKVEEEGIIFHLKSPVYYDEFLIIAQECTSLFGSTFPLPCTTSLNEGITALFVPRDELKKIAQMGESYRFSISPKEDPTLVMQTQVPLNLDQL